MKCHAFSAGNSNSYRNYFCCHEFQKKIKDDSNGKIEETSEKWKVNLFSYFDETWWQICPHFSFSTLFLMDIKDHHLDTPNPPIKIKNIPLKKTRKLQNFSSNIKSIVFTGLSSSQLKQWLSFLACSILTKNVKNDKPYLKILFISFSEISGEFFA